MLHNWLFHSNSKYELKWDEIWWSF
jgi:hypothetical protein